MKSTYSNTNVRQTLINSMSVGSVMSVADIIAKVQNRLPVRANRQTIASYIFKMYNDGSVIKYNNIGKNGGAGYKLNPECWTVIKK